MFARGVLFQMSTGVVIDCKTRERAQAIRPPAPNSRALLNNALLSVYRLSAAWSMHAYFVALIDAAEWSK